jgi:catalase
MGDAPLHIRQRHAQNCGRADADYGARIMAALGLG